MKIYIFSEVCYNDNKHINQYLFDYLTKKGIDCYFVERIAMNISLKKYLNKLLNKSQHTPPPSLDKINNKIIKTFIFPPIGIFKKINEFIFNRKKLILDSNDIVIAFIPHEHIFKLCGKKSKWVYYCVHDSTQQNYTNKKIIINFEKNILIKKSTVFCDNKEVVKKLGLTSIDYIKDHNTDICNHEKNHNNIAYLMPPPVPDEFYHNNKNTCTIYYDYVYYGSFHKDINIDILISISKSKSILIISNNCPSELITKENITIVPSIYSMEQLAYAINSASCILLPYKNSKFMETITPAKILQVKAFSKPVVCTNNYLAQKYGLSNDINNTIPPTLISPIFSVSEICGFIFNKIDSMP